MSINVGDDGASDAKIAFEWMNWEIKTYNQTIVRVIQIIKNLHNVLGILDVLQIS